MRKLLVTLALCLLFVAPSGAYAAIAVDATSAAANVTTISSTHSHTTTGTNLIMIFAVSAAINNANQIVSTITYNGDSATKIDAQTNATPIARDTELWYLIAPDTGTHDVVVTFANEPSDFFSVGVTTYTGAKQSAQPDASAKSENSANATSISQALTTVADNSWIVGAGTNLANGNANMAEAGSFLRQQIYERVPTGGYELVQLDSNGSKTPAGAYSQGWSWTGNAQSQIVVASIAPAADAAVGAQILRIARSSFIW